MLREINIPLGRAWKKIYYTILCFGFRFSNKLIMKLFCLKKVELILMKEIINLRELEKLKMELVAYYG